MKQRICSIILLIAFLGIFIHGMVPHHHHNNVNYGAEHSHVHTNDHNHSQGEHEHLEESCDISYDHFTDKHHSCPHHLHTCVIIELQIKPTNSSRSSLEKNKIPGFKLYHNKVNKDINPKGVVFVLHNLCSEIPISFGQGIEPLRGPPTV